MSWKEEKERLKTVSVVTSTHWRHPHLRLVSSLGGPLLSLNLSLLHPFNTAERGKGTKREAGTLHLGKVRGLGGRWEGHVFLTDMLQNKMMEFP